MSKALEAIENATSSQIEDTQQIDKIINGILDMPLEKFDGGIERYQYLSGDIAKGMVLDREKIEKLTLRDVLTLVYHEPCFPWFEVPEDTSLFLEEKPDLWFGSAGHSFFIAKVINERRKALPVLDRFCHINLWSLYKYLSDKMAEAFGHIQGEPHSDEVLKNGMRLNRLFSLAEEYIFNYTGPYADYDPLDGPDVGDLIRNACRIGTKNWICGTVYLKDYVDDIYHSYDIMRILFMESITRTLISPNKNSFRALLDSCSENGTYDNELYDEIEFQNLYAE